jgi:hypothetical protein
VGKLRLLKDRLRFVLVALVVVFAACAIAALVKLHQSNVATRTARLERLLQAKLTTRPASKKLTADVAEYASAYGTETAAEKRRGAADAATRLEYARDEMSAIGRARAANEGIATDLRTIARAYAVVYGGAATQRLSVEAALAHDACARSLEAWARAAGSPRDADAAPYYRLSKGEDRECELHGMALGNELESLGSRLDSDLAATQSSLSTL